VKPQPRCIGSVLHTDPLPAGSGWFARLQLRLVVRLAADIGQFVYPSAASHARHRRAGFPDDRSTVIAAGVDVDRFKPDFAARKRVRERLELPANAFVIGMQAPFQPEFDHITFLKAAGDIIRLNPHARILLAGRGLQRGNAPLMALVGGGTLATRVQLLGEWSDGAGLFNACDVVVSSALTDEMRMTLVMAMLCGVPCVATGIGAQGEVVGKFGIATEPGGEASLVRGISRIMEMPMDRRAFMARGARQHAFTHFNQARAVQRYQLLYLDAPAGATEPVEEPAPESGVPVDSDDIRLTAS
jgi:glycosyltransferase involved in cell wall biosynthesis